MKKGKTFNQVVAGTLAASILTSSCTQYPYINENQIYGNAMVSDSDLGEIAIPISLKLKSEDVQYINAIHQVSIDILDNPRKAKEFKENPSAYLKKYGYSGDVNLDDNLLKVTIALSDEDINKAIKKNDFKTFIKLCKDKNIISSSKGIFEDEFYKEQIKKMKGEDIEKIKKSLFRSDYSGEFVDERKGFFLPVVVVIALAAMLAVAAWAYLVFHAAVYTKGGTAFKMDDFSTDDFSIIDIYGLKNGMEETFIAVDNYTEEIVNESILAIKELQPDFFNNNSETEVRNLLKINIINNIANID
jgi:hypothetical protein